MPAAPIKRPPAAKVGIAPLPAVVLVTAAPEAVPVVGVEARVDELPVDPEAELVAAVEGLVVARLVTAVALAAAPVMVPGP